MRAFGLRGGSWRLCSDRRSRCCNTSIRTMNVDMFRRPYFYWWAAVLWTIGILVGCSIPPSTLSPVGPALSFDKLIHFGLFAVFGVLWMGVLCPLRGTTGRRLWRQGAVLSLVGVLFAGGTEVYQHVLPIKRMGDPYDALADSVGVVAGVATYVMYTSYVDDQAQSSVAN